LLTDYLKWVDRDGTLTSPREVTIHRGRSVLAGDNLVSRPNLKSATLSNTRFRFNTGDEKIQEYPLEGTGDDSESD
ncbi:MAG: hypothetical protein O3A46_07045, partial [Candidatus Poribacteria bacterium]|nr:hypothetical protein [Candidatus Poribacteria bacterium]